MDKRWTLKPAADQADVEHLASALGVSVQLAELLCKRGIRTYDEAHAFFRPQQSALHDPFLMKNMDKAVKAVEHAINKNQAVLVYGDYDVDGTSAVALVHGFLSNFTHKAISYIPDRYKEGYGLSDLGIEYAKEHQCRLLIALDCGIKALDPIAKAQEYGIQVIVCDHHQPGKVLPEAIILNPKQKDCNYPFKELTGCGVGFKLMQAYAYQQGYDFDAVSQQLDLVALSIGADIVPIVGENRSLAALGLQIIHNAPRPALKAILEPANRLKKCSISDLVFVVAPRINAAGRMDKGQLAVELLSEQSEIKALELAQQIETHNSDRKEVELITSEEALKILDSEPKDRFSNVVYDINWHKGVIGIVASRIIEKYYKPTVVITQSGDHLAGSVRSVKGFNVYQALEQCSEHMIQFGGHQYAAGLTLHHNQLDGFKTAFETAVKNTIDTELLTPEVLIDLDLDFADIQNGSTSVLPKFFRIVDQFAPFGPGNRRPVFQSKGVSIMYPRIVGKEHLQFTALQASHPNIKFRCIAFGQGHYLELLNKPVNLAYSLERNEWNGQVNLQLQVKDIQPA